MWKWHSEWVDVMIPSWIKRWERPIFSPWIFSSKNVLLPIFSPVVAVIVGSFKPGFRADFHLIRPCGQCLSATTKTKRRTQITDDYGPQWKSWAKNLNSPLLWKISELLMLILRTPVEFLAQSPGTSVDGKGRLWGSRWRCHRLRVFHWHTQFDYPKSLLKWCYNLLYQEFLSLAHCRWTQLELQLLRQFHPLRKLIDQSSPSQFQITLHFIFDWQLPQESNSTSRRPNRREF